MAWEIVTEIFGKSVPKSGPKFVLIAMGHKAKLEDRRAFMSVPEICAMTGQDRKSVIGNVSKLIEWGFLKDTGERTGRTSQVPIYEITEASKPVKQYQKRDALTVPKTEPVEESQKRNSSENGTVPNFPTNSTVFPHKQSQISHETVPKTGHGKKDKKKDKGKEKEETRPRRAASKPGLSIPDLVDRGVEKQHAEDWLAVRKTKRAGPVTETAWEAVVREAANAGIPVGEAVRICAVRSWVGFNADWGWQQSSKQSLAPLGPASNLSPAGQRLAARMKNQLESKVA